MALNDWEDGEAGGTPLSAERLNERDAAITALQTALEGKADTSVTDGFETRIAALEAAAEG